MFRFAPASRTAPVGAALGAVRPACSIDPGADLPSGAGGFTLVEMLVTMALLVTVTMLLLPGMVEFTTRNRMAVLESDVLVAAAQARSEAARNGLPVLLSAVSGGTTGNRWSNGWRLVLDSNRNGVADSTETVLRAHEALPADLKLDGTTSITFGESGYLSPASAVTLTLCRRDGNPRGSSVTITPSGQVDSTAITTCS